MKYQNIIKEQNEIFNTEDLKYVFEMPESPLKLINKNYE